MIQKSEIETLKFVTQAILWIAVRYLQRAHRSGERLVSVCVCGIKSEFNGVSWIESTASVLAKAPGEAEKLGAMCRGFDSR